MEGKILRDEWFLTGYIARKGLEVASLKEIVQEECLAALVKKLANRPLRYNLVLIDAACSF